MKDVGGNAALSPATSIVPYYEDGMTNCPYCDQPFLLDNLGERRLIYKNEMAGNLDQKQVEDDERKIA